MFEYTTNGIKYKSYLMDSAGAGFILFPDSEHNSEQVTAAINELRKIRDVSNIRIASDKDRDFLYQIEVLREPETKGLRWYQINVDPELIRNERIKGTSPEDYVKTYILPFVKQTEEYYLKCYGKQMYEI